MRLGGVGWVWVLVVAACGGGAVERQHHDPAPPAADEPPPIGAVVEPPSATVSEPEAIIPIEDGAAGLQPPPVAVAATTPAPAVGFAPLTVDLGAAASRCAPPGCAAIVWDFGDGSPAAAGPTARHVYGEGSFRAMVTVTDAWGRRATAVVPVEGRPKPSWKAARGVSVRVTHADATLRFLGVDRMGTAYAASPSAPGRLLASVDGARTWTPRGTLPPGSAFRLMAVLASGVLIADTDGPLGRRLARSADGGATWVDVLPLRRPDPRVSSGDAPLVDHMMLTPHSVAELDGTVYFLEYQHFSSAPVPVHLWASLDDGSTWEVRNTFTEHRHGHGLRADPLHHALWLFLGDATGATRLSTDGGVTCPIVRGADGGVLVDAAITPTGIVGALDALYRPQVPWVVTMGLDASYSRGFQLPGPSYSFHALPGGGYLVGAAREPGGDVYPAGDVSAHLFATRDGVAFEEIGSFPRSSALETARVDAYFQLPSGDTVLQLRNVAEVGANGLVERRFAGGTVGYELVEVTFR